MAKKSDAFDFEKALKELEALVERMEAGDLSLEESLKDFERGVALTRACQKALAEAEQKVQILLNEEGREKLEPFSEQQNNEQ
ncbi:MAG: exodeoxyribonuclease VII small subunit [Gammaproteobacteria bacterium]